MTEQSIYLVSGIKNYPSYTGDSNVEYVRFISSGTSFDAAVKNVKDKYPDAMDEVKKVIKVYTIAEKCIKDEDGFWDTAFCVDDAAYNLNEF